MKRICNGPMEFTPYRPWSQERRDAARAREIARLALTTRRSSAGRTLPRVFSKIEWTAPVLTDITPIPKRPWSTPRLVDISPIHEADCTGDVLLLNSNWDLGDIEFKKRTYLRAVEVGDHCFYFERSLMFSPGPYCVDVASSFYRVEISTLEGFEQSVSAFPRGRPS